MSVVDNGARKKRLADDHWLLLEKRMQVYMSEPKKTMTKTMLDIAEFIESSVQKKGEVISLSAFQELVQKEMEGARRRVL